MSAVSLCGCERQPTPRLRSLQIAGARTEVDPGAADGRWRNGGVADLLCDALMTHGHEVTLFAAPGFRSPARLHPLLEPAHPNTIGSALHESHHVARASGPIDLATARACCWMRFIAEVAQPTAAYAPALPATCRGTANAVRARRHRR